jgi:hypothetical protein
MFLRGWNPNAGGNDPNRAFGTPQLDDFKSHNHAVGDPGHFHSITAYAGNLVGNQYTLATTNANVVLTSSLLSIQRAKTNISVKSTGGTETRPVNVALLPCICASPTPGVLVENPALPNNLGAVYGNATNPLNTVVGYLSGANLDTTSNNNVILGTYAGASLTSGDGNIAIGNESLNSGEGVSNNIGIGSLTLNLLEGGSETESNIAIGNGALSNLTTGRSNIVIGPGAGAYFQNGIGNVLIGGYGGGDITGGTYPNDAIILSSAGFDGSTKLIINQSGSLSFSNEYPGADYGTPGQVLQSNGPNARPTWVNAGGFQTYPIFRTSTLTATTTGSYGTAVVIYDVANTSNIVAQYNGANGRFQPTLAGFWTIQASARCFDDATLESNVRIVKNGTTQVAICGSYGQVAGNVAATVYFNGTTDYATINIITATAATNPQTSSYFSAFYVGN